MVKPITLYSLLLIKGTLKDIKTIHILFYKSIDEANAGTWRKENIIVSGSEYVFPQIQEIDEKMSKLEEWIKTKRDNYNTIISTVLLHLKLVSIDGNGRTSHLIMNLALIQDGYQLAIIPPLLRSEYNDTIRQHQNKNKPELLYDFTAERIYETQKEIMRLLHIHVKMK